MPGNNKFFKPGSTGNKGGHSFAKYKVLMIHKDLIEMIAYRIDLRLSLYESVRIDLLSAPLYFSDLLMGKWGGALLAERTIQLLKQFQQSLSSYLEQRLLHSYVGPAFYFSDYATIRSKLIECIRELEADMLSKGIDNFTSYRDYEYILKPTTEELRDHLQVIKLTSLVNSKPNEQLIKEINQLEEELDQEFNSGDSSY